MVEIIGFQDLKVGQRVKIKGQPAEPGEFIALELAMKFPKDQAEIEGLVQNIDYDQKSLCIFNRDFSVPDGAIIKDLNKNSISLEDIQKGDMIKLKGKYSEADGFSIEKIKREETMGFNIEELQGNIDFIDPEEKTLSVLGFKVILNQKTMIEGF